jgi:hypothetical protein
MAFPDLKFISLNINCVKILVVLSSTSLNFDDFARNIQISIASYTILALIILILQAISVNSIFRKTEFSTVHTNTLIIQTKY